MCVCVFASEARAGKVNRGYGKFASRPAGRSYARCMCIYVYERDGNLLSNLWRRQRCMCFAPKSRGPRRRTILQSYKVRLMRIAWLLGKCVRYWSIRRFNANKLRICWIIFSIFFR